MQYTEKELTKLLADVEKEFTSHLAKAEENFRLAKSENESAAIVKRANLAKAEEDSEDKEKEEDKKEDKKEAAPAAKEDSKKESKKAPESKEAAEKAEGEEAEEAPAKEAEEAADASDSNGAYDDEDLAQLREMYASMSFEELMAHHDAVKECLDAMADEEEAPAEAEAAPAMAEAAPAEEGKTMDKDDDMGGMGGMGMQMSEKHMGKSEIVGVELIKSELAAEKAKNEELKKSYEAVQEFITKLVAKRVAPSGKAITAIETIAKSEISNEVKQLSKSEITATLNKKAADKTLSKSDREAINAYYGSGQVSIEKISHLLK